MEYLIVITVFFIAPLLTIGVLYCCFMAVKQRYVLPNFKLKLSQLKFSDEQKLTLYKAGMLIFIVWVFYFENCK